MKGLSALETALDAERRGLMRENEERLEKYLKAGQKWVECWKKNDKKIKEMPLRKAHEEVIKQAKEVLPFHV
jgi:isopropylmalate/homocitrate/citramalate synthase